MKILNLYAGIGGNRQLWGNDHEITAIEIDEEIANEYKQLYPNDNVVCGDAHQYLLDHYEEFDFIWSSPPCPTHSRMRRIQKTPKYPDMKLYEEIILLKHNFKGIWIVENVISYYDPLIMPVIVGRHYIWSNKKIMPKKFEGINISKATKEQLAEYHNMPVTRRQYLRNCVNPKIARYIYDQL